MRPLAGDLVTRLAPSFMGGISVFVRKDLRELTSTFPPQKETEKKAITRHQICWHSDFRLWCFVIGAELRWRPNPEGFLRLPVCPPCTSHNLFETFSRSLGKRGSPLSHEHLTCVSSCPAEDPALHRSLRFFFFGAK